VLVEKPVAISADECRAMIKAGREADRLLMVAQVMRFSREGHTLQRWVDAGLVGDIYWGYCTLLRPRGVPRWGQFIDAEASGGGPCYDLAVHILDMALYLMGFPEPVTVSAATYLKIANKPSLMKHDPGKYTVPEDMAAGFIRFANGAALSVQTSWALNVTEAAARRDIVLCGTEGGLQYSPPTLVREENGMLLNSVPQVPVDVPGDGFVGEIAAFVEAILKGKPSPVRLVARASSHFARVWEATRYQAIPPIPPGTAHNADEIGTAANANSSVWRTTPMRIRVKPGSSTVAKQASPIVLMRASISRTTLA